MSHSFSSSPKKSLDAKKTCSTDLVLGCRPMPDQELVAQGWEKRFVGDERMIQESVSTYEALGYEVKLLPLSESSLREECQGCFLTLSTFRILYTRKKALV